MERILKWECCCVWKQPFERSLKREHRFNKKWWLKIWIKKWWEKEEERDKDAENGDWMNDSFFYWFFIF